MCKTKFTTLYSLSWKKKKANVRMLIFCFKNIFFFNICLKVSNKPHYSTVSWTVLQTGSQIYSSVEGNKYKVVGERPTPCPFWLACRCSSPSLTVCSLLASVLEERRNRLAHEGRSRHNSAFLTTVLWQAEHHCLEQMCWQWAVGGGHRANGM